VFIDTGEKAFKATVIQIVDVAFPL
jgi:hypothetical protein